MAKMKIYQSEFQAKTQKVMDIGGALSLPYEIAQAQGASINKLTSAIKKIRDERQATQDKNKSRKIIKEIDNKSDAPPNDPLRIIYIKHIQ